MVQVTSRRRNLRLPQGDVERVLQELLEAEMTEHIGAAPLRARRGAQGPPHGYKPRT